MSEPRFQVLARKYRPKTFDDLVGQAEMVRTLKNAFEADRIAQAFILTGIRGTGKTTTARIIAKGLNCVGPGGEGGPTTAPCGVCEPCRAIQEGRHVDVLEMDGASQTGVENVRENIIGTVAYAPASARFKIFIVDEVHMLSPASFNALLKTLEEPPPHVKFIFATTEIRKVPVTVLSRCQRFDLRRIEPETTIALLSRIADAEGAEIDEAALALIARAAEGSARDATSLLDQAISHGAGAIGADAVRAMLGLADRARILDLFETIMRGDAAAALAEIAAQYADGADPLAILRDLAEVTHWVSVVKISPEATADPTITSVERDRGLDLAGRLGMPVLSRAWQMLLKAIEEVGHAPNAMMAAEMAIIRLTHVADLPTPGDLVRKLQSAPPAVPVTPPPAPPVAPDPAPGPNVADGADASPARPNAAITARGAVAAELAVTPDAALSRFARFEHVVALIRTRRDVKLLIDVENGLRLVAYAPGRIAFTPADGAPADLAQRLSARLAAWTGARWGVVVEDGGTAPTIAEARDAGRHAAEAEALGHPLVRAVLDAFPTATISDIRTPAPPDAAEPPPEADDGWDPLEDPGER